MAQSESEVTIAQEARAAFCLFLQSNLGPPTDRQGQIRYPDVFGVIRFLNQANAPGHVQAAAIMVCYNMAGGPLLDYEKRLGLVSRRGLGLVNVSVRPGAERVLIEDRIHEFCQTLDTGPREDRLLLTCALIAQLLEQIKINISQIGSRLRDYLSLMHDQLIKFSDKVADKTRHLITQVLESNRQKAEVEAV